MPCQIGNCPANLILPLLERLHASHSLPGRYLGSHASLTGSHNAIACTLPRGSATAAALLSVHGRTTGISLHCYTYQDSLLSLGPHSLWVHDFLHHTVKRFLSTSVLGKFTTTLSIISSSKAQNEKKRNAYAQLTRNMHVGGQLDFDRLGLDSRDSRVHPPAARETNPDR
jgi:hypothetical protein